MAYADAELNQLDSSTPAFNGLIAVIVASVAPSASPPAVTHSGPP